jgi:MOSC domain-containing protein YiiM
MTGRLLAVSVGRPQDVGGTRTAIWKAPAEGRVAARGVNLEGDDQADRSVHGGPDKAVYAYAREDAAWWEDVLGRDLGPGSFGENLTTEGLSLTDAVIGERWAVGGTLLEVCQPRFPCAKLGLRFGDPLMVRRFAKARRPGAYLRILEEGDLGAGDAIEVVDRPAHDVTIALVNEVVLHDRSRLPELLGAPELAASLREFASDA